MKLYMLLLGAEIPGRNTEQHDVCFLIGSSLKELAPSIVAFWPEAGKTLHIDAWREVNSVDQFRVAIVPRSDEDEQATSRLFFLNLGGYKKNEFDEFHYKHLVAATDKGEAVRKAKLTAFYKHMGFKGATSHIDDKYGVDVDNIYEINDILPDTMKQQYSIKLTPDTEVAEDEIQLGYFRLNKL